jgi:hypothetical protein
MRFIYQCWAGERHWGLWLEKEERLGRVRDLRSQHHRVGHELSLPTINLEAFRRLQSYKIIKLWNLLPFTGAQLDAHASLRSLTHFTSALPSLYSHLPQEALQILGKE